MPEKVTDLIAASVLVSALQQVFPGSKIDGVAASRLNPVLKCIPGIFHTFRFSKKEYKGWFGAIRFGRRIASHEAYDLCINLNTSFKSCLMVFFTGTLKRVGFTCAFAPFLLTHYYKKSPGILQYPAYLHLIVQYSGREIKTSGPRLQIPDAFTKNTFSNQPYIMVYCGQKDFDSHISSSMAYELMNYILHKYPLFNILIGGHQSKYILSNPLAGEIIMPERVSVFENEDKYSDLIRALYNASVLITKDREVATIARSLNIRAIVPATFRDSPKGEENDNEVWVAPDAAFDEWVSALHAFLG